jgi:hypothetical protein
MVIAEQLQFLNFLSHADVNRRQISRKGGIELIVSAMKAHSKDASVLEKLCGAFRNLAANCN